ncbi:MAG: transposase family protein [Thermosphaera sp.]
MGKLRASVPSGEPQEKTRILDETVALTGCHRKSAIRLLRHGYRPPRLDRRGRPRRYAPDVKATLLAVWEACGYICSKRLAPFLPEIVAVLKRHGELRLRPETERLLLQVSPATIDRLLRPHRPKPLRGRTTTKPGTLLKHQIPVRTFADWDESKPGFLEVDLVAHCGESARGEYLHTLTAVDVDTRWCELEVLPNRSQQAVGEAIDRIRRKLPFPLLGIDSDNDSAFLNGNLTRYCAAQRITFTRCRPYKKNDQAHVEEKNWSAVRKLVGSARYESAEALALLRAIYADWRLFLNFFQPVREAPFQGAGGEQGAQGVRPGADPVPKGARLTLGERGDQS